MSGKHACIPAVKPRMSKKTISGKRPPIVTCADGLFPLSTSAFTLLPHVVVLLLLALCGGGGGGGCVVVVVVVVWW